MNTAPWWMGLLLAAACANAEPPPTSPLDEGPMTNARLGTVIARIDAEAKGGEGRWQLSVEGYNAMVLTDATADRMRIMVPVASIDGLQAEVLLRMLQANFDSVLDARYAIAHGQIWSVFLHPLGSLTEHDFVSGLGQAVTAAATFGKSYSSGALIFNGGDTGEAQRELYRAIMERGLSI